MAGTDSTKAKVPFGSFILTEQATNEFPWVTELASRYSASPSEVAGGQNAILTNGETYFPPEAVRDIGVDTLRQMNNKPKEGGHASIDRLIAMSTLQGLKPMYGGGEITPNYSGGGLTGYQEGDKVSGLSRLLSMITPKGRRQKAYEELVPQDMRNDERIYTIDPSYGNTDTLLEFENPVVEEIQAINRLTNADFTKDQRLNPLAKSRVDAINQLLYGIAPQPLGEQGTVAESVPLSGEEPIAGFYHPEMRFTYEDQIDRARRQYMNKQQGGLTGYQNGGGTTFNDAIIAARTPFRDLKPNPDTGMYDVESIAGIARDGGRDYYMGKGSADSPSAAAHAAHLMALKNSMSGEPMDIDPSDVGSYFKPKKKGILGLLGFQDGDMVGPPVPPQMMGDAMNRQLSESIDMRMANPEVYQGSTLGAVRQEASALQDSIYQDTVNKARKSLQLIKLQTLLNNPDMTMQSYTEGEFLVPSDKAGMVKWGMSALRDSSNMRALDLMKKLTPAGSGSYMPR